ncbi:MAG: ribosome maturation factor [Chitinophagales bacterium]
MATILKRIKQLLELRFEEDSSFFIVELKPVPGNKIQIFVDRDNNVTSGDCVKIFKYLRNSLEEEELWHENLYLEVSSPGMSKPFKVMRQYKKNQGRHVIVQLIDGNLKEGILKETSDEEIVIEEHIKQKKKKLIIQETTIPFDAIKHVKKKVTF